MESHETEPAQELRDKTDKSLEAERGKTDEYLEQTLIGNSLKFTPKGSAIELSARKQETQVEISVTDNNGPGISKQTQARIFEKFSQLKMNDRRGLGLGLVIAKWIIDAHQGHIWVTSNVGKGSMFSFTLPLTIAH